MNPGVRSALLVLLALTAMGSPATFAGDAGTPPPPELRKLEREVSLKLAHVRDEESYDSSVRAQLHEAHQLDMTAEKNIAAGDYDTARDNLVKANAILGRLAM
jgi:hypothetical protein